MVACFERNGGQSGIPRPARMRSLFDMIVVQYEAGIGGSWHACTNSQQRYENEQMVAYPE